MILLLDTHVLLWAAYAPDRLTSWARALLEDGSNTLMFSSASLWEVAIKASLGRPDFTVDASTLRRGLIESGYVELSITSAHAVGISTLPALHSDPFDRMLIAQARHEGVTLVTADSRVGAYGAGTLLV